MVFHRERRRSAAGLPPGVVWCKGTVVGATVVVVGIVVTVDSEAKENPRPPVTTATRIAVMTMPAAKTEVRANRTTGILSVPGRAVLFERLLVAT
jgi:hypothetical protein